MENLINEYVEAIKVYKNAQVAFDLCEAQFIDVATLKLKAAEERVAVLHKILKESEQFGGFEKTFKRAAWRNIAAGITFCNRTV